MDKSRINELLRERGLTMQDLAKAMNISYQALHVSSSANSTLSRLKEIVSILFVNMVELFVHRRTSFAILSAVLYWGAKNAEKRKEPENEKKNYICMKKELGKWLMDIAKYIATAVVISSIFTESKGALFWIGAFLAIVATLFSGLWLINLAYKRKE